MGTDTAALDSLLEKAIAMNASDIHLAAGQRVFLRKDGALLPAGESIHGRNFLEACLLRMTSEKQRERLRLERDLDFSWEVCGRRFRGNAYIQRGLPAIALRLIPDSIPPLDSLGVPASLTRLLSAEQGLVLVTGRTGAGKSTTLASFIDALAKSRPAHILTLEDPIEFIHTSEQCLISQRELGRDFLSFPQALKSALREMPDVILVGEIRDAGTMQMVLDAASTGALVLGTLHTKSAAETAMRVEGMFPAGQRDAVRDSFGGVFTGVFSQQLLPALSGGRVSATEALVATPAARSLIRQGKYAQLTSLMMGGRALGMQTMSQALDELVTRRIISRDSIPKDPINAGANI